jgi:chemosensory pili system protein ChpA (sensor histidine kinase/response regulator)
MENQPQQRFCDEVEQVLDGIRADLLVYQQDPDSIPRFPVHTERVASLASSVQMCEAAGIDHAIAQLYSHTSALSTVSGRIPGDDVRTVLDRISDIESKIAIVRMSDNAFTDDLDRLLDVSLETIRRKPQAVADVQNDQRDGDHFEIDNELLDIFEGEANDLLANMEANLRVLASDPVNKESLWELRRAAHTFKGSSGLVGLIDASRLAHRIEDLLDGLSEGPRLSSDGVAPVLLLATDCLRELVGGGKTRRLEAAIERVYADLDRLSGSGATSLPELPAANPAESVQAASASKKLAKPIVRVPLEQLDALVGLIRDLVVNRSVIGQRFAEFDRRADELHDTARRLRAVNSRLEVDLSSVIFEADNAYRTSSSSIPTYAFRTKGTIQDHFHALEIDRYSELHESVRDLAETAADAAAIDQAIESLREQLGILHRQQTAIFDEIQDRVMGMRMIPFSTLETRLERAVRVTCEDEKKKAALSIENGDTELDTQMLDEIVEPLLHLLKNAVVHGIEPPETRRLLGKSETGSIKVRVDDQDTHIMLTVSDDGSGIALSSLKERAIATGDIGRENAATLSDQEVAEMIFKPGLTTARRLNLNAGRGVGMNIVRDSIESNNGTISVASGTKSGTSFTIRLPLKLAITNALLVSSSGGTYAVPLKHIERIVEVMPGELIQEYGNVMWETSGQKHAFCWLDESIGLPIAKADDSQVITALIVKTATSQLAVGVDGVIRTEEVVITPLAKPFDDIRDVLGIGFLSSGELAPILDLPYLLASDAKQRGDRSTAAPRVKKTFVMVVDDSPSVRHMTTKVIHNAGWEVISAKDGMDALEVLKGVNRLPDLILTDIEMPRMGGFELAAAVLNDPTLSEIPVVAITSRTAEKHRQKARDNGVSAYLVKPYEESELIRLVRSLTSTAQQKAVTGNSAD